MPSNSAAIGADDLRARMRGTAAEKQASSERLKLMRDGREQATMLNERALFYKLPSGRRVEAILLPNGKRSPAITERGELVPACYTTRETLVAGRYDERNKRVVCNVPAADIAYIDDELYVEQIQKEHSEKQGYRSDEANADGGGVGNIDKYGNNKRGGNNKLEPNSNGQKVSQAPAASGGSAAQTPQINLPADFYMPTNSNQNGKAAVSVMALSKAKPYGIQRGTWVNIRLNRSVSSGDSGQAEFILENDIAGTYQTLPSGTLFFANKQINMGTKRMEALVNLAKLPDGKEIKVSGWVYSLNQTAGLNGVLERDREGENKAAVGNAALAGLGTAASAAVPGGGDVAGAAISSYTGEMVSNERKYSERAPAATIRVSPQRALLQIAQPF